MASAPVRESAIAKRRRLNNGTASESSASTRLPRARTPDDTRKEEAKTQKDNSQTRTSATKPNGKATKVAETSARRELIQISDGTSRHQISGIDDENTFSALPESGIVSFSETRELEGLPDGALKVRLSRGQKCVVSGLAQLWVREGSITICGAVLHECERAYAIQAPREYGGVFIRALSKDCEFQLESIAGLSKLERQYSSQHQAWSENNATSFEIADLDDTNRDDVKQVKGLDLDSLSRVLCGKSPATQLGSDFDSKLCRILVAGKSAALTGTVCAYIANNLLTSNANAPTDVAVFDMEPISPVFGTPGSISITLVHQVLLSSIYCQQLLFDNEKLQPQFSYYTSASTREESQIHLLDTLETCLSEFLQACRKTGRALPPVILRAGSWYTLLPPEGVQRIQSLFQADHVLNCTNTVIHWLKTSHKSAPERLSIDAQSSPGNLLVHRLALESSLAWHKSSHTLGKGTQKLCFFKTVSQSDALAETNRDAIIVDTIWIRGKLARQEDIQEMLDGRLVFIVKEKVQLTKEEKSTESISQMMYGTRISSMLDTQNQVELLGLAIIEGFNVVDGYMTLYINQDLLRILQPGSSIGIVVEVASKEGYFDKHLLEN